MYTPAVIAQWKKKKKKKGKVGIRAEQKASTADEFWAQRAPIGPDAKTALIGPRHTLRSSPRSRLVSSLLSATLRAKVVHVQRVGALRIIWLFAGVDGSRPPRKVSKILEIAQSTYRHSIRHTLLPNLQRLENTSPQQITTGENDKRLVIVLRLVTWIRP
ncbi:uncharacterized protein CIMG_10769 [Coccidioides immitis RS]|uniref:Uncharacterized protein n=3 Tax=Coccidioides immitis TaxID=5501 RepID=A0A0D8JT75_COCIM|nr:uncharacterized protein CIMG_10769 [Coccidioides immitis RS]KJF60146.1 hypothetical protein CIMG_10769 [Coccidioides immitis RS]KMP01505.1 hypothetical protein CIRG_01643 [Coccidioides immitis RMSCC 2394]KMU76520.1 hypothetical protein CISG_01253 [Coccidioides immitis RMSCC 3703]